METNGNIVCSFAFLDWLKSMGIVPRLASRVVIDARADSIEPIKIYVEMAGNEAMLDDEFSAIFAGIKVEIIGNESKYRLP